MSTAGRDFVASYLAETAVIAAALDPDVVEGMAERLAAVRADGGRLFICGVGGGAGHASHAVNDFRKLCDLEAYAPSDNISELTARVNDDGWDTAYSAWLRTSRLSSSDALLVFSVGGGSLEHGISLSLVSAIELARGVGATVLAVVGRADGVAVAEADSAIVIPAPPSRLTPHTEAFQAVLWHLLVSHPALATQGAMWETLAAAKS